MSEEKTERYLLNIYIHVYYIYKNIYIYNIIVLLYLIRYKNTYLKFAYQKKYFWGYKPLIYFITYIVKYKYIFYSPIDKVDGLQLESIDDKIKVKHDDKSKQKHKLEENIDKPNGRTNNNEAGNCYW